MTRETSTTGPTPAELPGDLDGHDRFNRGEQHFHKHDDHRLAEQRCQFHFQPRLLHQHNPNAANYGEGQTYLGSTTVTTDAQGNATYSVTFTVAVPVGQYVTATATDQRGNTSEFSQVFALNASNAINEPR